METYNESIKEKLEYGELIPNRIDDDENESDMEQQVQVLYRLEYGDLIPNRLDDDENESDMEQQVQVLENQGDGKLSNIEIQRNGMIF